MSERQTISVIADFGGNEFELKDSVARSGLANKIDSSLKGANGGVAELDNSGKVPSSQLNERVLVYNTASGFPEIGTSGKIYLALDEPTVIYVWDSVNSEYTTISGGSGESVLLVVPFSIATTDWTAITGGYSASITNSNIVANSVEFIVYDDSITNLTSNISTAKDGTNHTYTFTVETVPSGTIAGTLYVVNTGTIYILNNYIEKHYNNDDFVPCSFSGISSNFNVNNIWTDGENIYYSGYSEQYVLDKLTLEWTAKTWTGLTNFYGINVWTDGENIYHSDDWSNSVLDKSTSTWSTKTWSGLTSFSGRYVWTDGENVYYGNSTSQYVLNKSTSTWSEKAWSGSADFSVFDPFLNIWTDGENVYFSNYSKQYVLDKLTSTWSEKTWTGLTSFEGLYVWTDGENIYFGANANYQYILDKSTSTWTAKSWTGLTSVDGSNIWTDGDGNYYYSNIYKLNKSSTKVLLGTNGEFNPVPISELPLSGSDISTNAVPGAANVDEALGVLSTAIGTNSDAIATLNSNLYEDYSSHFTTTSIVSSLIAVRIGKMVFVEVGASGTFTSGTWYYLASFDMNLATDSQSMALRGSDVTYAGGIWGSKANKKLQFYAKQSMSDTGFAGNIMLFLE